MSRDCASCLFAVLFNRRRLFMPECSYSLLFTAQFLVTYRAINYTVIMSGNRASSLNAVFFHRRRLFVSKCSYSLIFSTQFFAANRAINH